MSLLFEFKAFVILGNVVDLAIVAPPSPEVQLLTEIRDELKSKK